MDLFSWGQLFTIMMLAIAISMDAFSLGIGVGMSGIRIRHMIKISLIVGLFHILMPLIGMAIGHLLSHYIGHLATMLGGALLIFLGAQMLWTSLLTDNSIGKSFIPTGLSLPLFALSVSLDALSTGFSLGLFSADTLLTISMFGFWGTSMSMLGLLIGRHVGGWLGNYGEALGGFILLSLGIRFLF